MNKKIIVLFVLVVLNAFAASAVLVCDVETGPCSSGTKVLGMSNYTNAHAELASQSNYNEYVCCYDTGAVGIGTDSSGTVFLHLSNVTNAHVEKTTENNYDNNATISTDDVDYIITCGHGTDNCDGYDTCLATITNDTNAHIGNCSEYSTTVCCSIAYSPAGGPVIPEFSTVGIVLALIIISLGVMIIKKRGIKND